MKRHVPVEEQYRHYYGGYMHDSGVLAIERASDQVVITLNCDLAYCYARCVSAILEIDEPDDIWPVKLILQDVRYATGVRPDVQGILRWTNWLKTRPFTSMSECDTYLHDWFFEQDSRLQYVGELWAWRKPSGKFDSSMFVLVDCAKATAIDMVEGKLAKWFSPAVGLLWQDIRRYRTAGGEMVNLIGEWQDAVYNCLAARNLTVDDLRI